MALSRGKKVLLGICISLLVIVIALPFVLGAILQGTIASKIKAAVKGPVEIGSVKVHLLPPGATINDLVIGDVDPAANNQKLLSIGSVYASVPFGVVFGGDLHVTSLGLSDVTANISVNDSGESTFTKFLHAQPPSDRKTALPIDSIQIKNLKVASYVSTKLTNTQKSSGAVDGKLDVKYLSVQDLVLPAPNSAPPAGNWIKVVLDSVRITGVPTEISAPAAPAVTEGAAIESLTINLALPGSPDKPMEIKNFSIRNPQIGVAVRKEDQTPSLSRAITALQLAVADDKPVENAQPAKILVQDMLVDNGRFEYRGPDGEGKPAFWRLANLKASGSNIAAGPGVQPAGTGGLRITSDSEASTGPGRFSMELVNLTGSYPTSTAQFSFKNEKIAATPFSLQAEQNAKFGIKAGTLTIELNGPITDGALKIDGAVVVSEDLEATGGMRAKIASITRGVPLKPVEVRGTMDKPTINPPAALAVLGAVFSRIVLGGAGELTQTLDNVVSGAVPEEVGKVIQSTEQVEKIPVIGDKLKKGTDMLKKIPGAGGLFKKKQ